MKDSSIHHLTLFCFNSLKVRLKDELFKKFIDEITVFQFLKGAIKSKISP